MDEGIFEIEAHTPLTGAPSEDENALLEAAILFGIDVHAASGGSSRRMKTPVRPGIFGIDPHAAHGGANRG